MSDIEKHDSIASVVQQWANGLINDDSSFMKLTLELSLPIFFHKKFEKNFNQDLSNALNLSIVLRQKSQ